jgi:hypothetical protein
MYADCSLSSPRGLRIAIFPQDLGATAEEEAKLLKNLDLLGFRLPKARQVTTDAVDLESGEKYLVEFGEYGLTSLRRLRSSDITGVLTAILSFRDKELMEVTQSIIDAVSRNYGGPKGVSPASVANTISDFFAKKLLELGVNGRIDSRDIMSGR